MPIRQTSWPGMIAAAVSPSGVPRKPKSYPPLFGAKEIGSTNWNFKKGVIPDWRAMLGRWKRRRALRDQDLHLQQAGWSPR